MVLVLALVAVGMLLMENVTPLTVTQRMIFSSKYTLMLSKAEMVAASLNTSTELTGNDVSEVLDVLGLTDVNQILVTDEAGAVLFCSGSEGAKPGDYALYPEITGALLGSDMFRCEYTGTMFQSCVSIPVLSSGNLIGAVYLVELDTEQAALLQNIQSNMRKWSIAAVVVFAGIFFVFAVMITRKNQKMLESIRMVRQGEYSYRIAVKGHDEYAQLEEEFNALTDRLQKTEEVRRQFVSDASHELRTPLASIRLLADTILQNEMDVDTIREFAQDISSEAERLTRMTKKLLTLTSLDAPEQEPEPVNLAVCCQKAVRMLTPSAREKGATIEESCEADCVISGREDDIYQIILNLAENGIKYSQTGGQVRLIAYRQSGQAILIVEDNGIGIPEDELSRIFERFYRVDKARSREAGGTGLGLSIVKETVEKCGGTVEASNRPQGGARFTVCFPLLEQEVEP